MDEERAPAATESPAGSTATARPVMDVARITLAVIFAMLLLGLVTSFILTRS